MLTAAVNANFYSEDFL